MNGHQSVNLPLVNTSFASPNRFVISQSHDPTLIETKNQLQQPRNQMQQILDGMINMKNEIRELRATKVEPLRPLAIRDIMTWHACTGSMDSIASGYWRI